MMLVPVELIRNGIGYISYYPVEQGLHEKIIAEVKEKRYSLVEPGIRNATPLFGIGE